MEWETVTGRLMMTGSSGVGSQIFNTALQISRANSGSVPVKLSGEYSNRKCPSVFARYSLQRFAPSSASLMMSSLLFLNTCSRCATEVEL